MSELICMKCKQRCDLLTFKAPVEYAPGVASQAVYSTYALSHCCRAHYRLETVAEEIQRETLQELELQRGVRV